MSNGLSPTQPTHSDEVVNLCFRPFTIVDIVHKLESYRLMEAAVLQYSLASWKDAYLAPIIHMPCATVCAVV